jgi:hypothetical protein
MKESSLNASKLPPEYIRAASSLQLYSCWCWTEC